MVDGDRHVGAAGVLHRRGGRAAVAVRVGVAGGVQKQQSRRLQLEPRRLVLVAEAVAQTPPEDGASIGRWDNTCRRE